MQDTIPKTDAPEQPKDEIVESKAVENQEPDVTPEEKNWRKFREDREKDRKKLEEQEKIAQQKAEEAEALKKALEAVVNKPNSQQYQEPEEESEEQRISKEVDRILQVREKARAEAEAQRELAEMPQRLASNFKDFGEVVTSENLDYLEYHFKEIAEPYKEMRDSYKKWELLYHAIKKHIPDAAKKKRYEELAAKNLSAPQSSSTPTVASKSNNNPHILSESAKEANWQAMQRRMKGLE